MSFKQLLLILKARWILTLGIAVGVVTIVALWSLVLPAQYTATASVLVDGRGGSIDPIAGVVLPTGGSSNFIATQVDIIGSERVIRRALRKIKATDSPAIREQWAAATHQEGDFESWLSSLIVTKLDVRPTRESNVINVSYSGTDRQFASAMTNAIVQAYVDTTRELRVEPAKQYSAFFDERGKQARDELERAQAKLSAFQQQNGIISADERLDVENARLAELSSQLVALQAIASESRNRQYAANTRGDRTTEVLGNPVIVGLTTDLGRTEARLTEMSERFGDKHPAVQELKANIRQLKARIESETRRVSASVGVTSDINQSRAGQVQAALDAQRAKVLKLKALRDQLNVLQRDVEHAQRNYDNVMGRANQTNLESQNNQTNVSVLKDATPPPFPSAPRTGLNVMIASILGLLIGIGVSLLIEVITPRLRSEDDISARIKLPVLAVLPTSSKSTTPILRARNIVQQITESPRRLLN